VARSGSAGFSPERFRDARIRAGKSPAGLAREAGVPRSDISKYEAGQAAPQPPRLGALARALGVSARALLEVPADGESLAHVRAAAGLTQAQLADHAGVTRKRYELAELGQRPLSGADIVRVAAAAGTSAVHVRAAHDRDVAQYKARRGQAAAAGTGETG
jgi:transcriptional regulator with XRE-family HTH domain